MRISSPLNSIESPVEIVKLLLGLLKIQVTTTTIEKDLNDHPDYPSLLSIGDVLTSYGIENVSFVSSLDRFEQFPLPFIAPVKSAHSRENYFVIIRAVTDKGIEFYNSEAQGWKTESHADFNNLWPSHIVMIIDAKDGFSEKDYAVNARKEMAALVGRYAAYLALPFLVILNVLLTFGQQGRSALYPAAFSLFTILGFLACCLLLLFELDQYNPFLKQICSAGKKVNCQAVLSSKASKIAGFTWSSIGFTYFSGGLFMLLLNSPTNPTILCLLSWINLLAVPYIFFSIYYQARITRQWCVLCLCVIILLALQCATAFAGGWLRSAANFSNMGWQGFLQLLFCYLTPFIFVNLLLPALRSAKENRINKAEILRLKHNADVFDGLLARQTPIQGSTEGLGIIVGNPNAGHKIIKVCNPYCGPCARAHRTIEDLVEGNPDIQLQIIFTATGKENDRAAPPAKHLLAIAQKGDGENTKKALHDWYLAKVKDYPAFAAKYPINGHSDENNGQLQAMHEWCEKNDIRFTPTFFVNGHRLLDTYSVDNLRYLLAT